MIDLKEYLRKAIRLINSLTIKIEDEAFITNFRLSKLTGKLEEDPSLQKYYLNLAGIPHPTDIPIITYIPDIDKIGEITVDNIKTYTTLRSRLLEFGNEFNKLVEKYPMQSVLIRGMLNPIDLNTALSADDGSILYYNKDYVNPNETDLIYRLENFIKNYLNRYHIKGYMIDEYYMSAMLSNLYSGLVLYVLAIRLRNVLTYQADNFHINNHFYGFRYLTNIDKLLNLPTKINFYGMLNYIKTNIGKNEVFDYLVNYLLENSGVGVANISIGKKVPTINNDEISDIKSEFIIPNNNIKIDPLNSTFTSNTVRNITYEVITKLQREEGYITIDIDINEFLDELMKDLNKLNRTETDTKSFLLTINDLGIFYPNTLLEIIFLNINYFLSKEIIKIDTKFFLPTIGKTILLNNKKVLYLFIKLLLSIREDTTDNFLLSSIVYDYVYEPITDVSTILTNLLSKDVIEPIANFLINLLNTVANPQTESEFYKYITVIKYVNIFLWYLISNVNDQVLSSDLKILANRLFKTGRIYYNPPVDINKELDLEELNYISKDNALLTLRKLLKDVFNLSVREVDYIIERLTNFMKLSKNLTSYTVQFLFNYNAYNVKYLYKNSIMVGNGAVGIFDIDYAKYKLHEKNHSFHDYYNQFEYLEKRGEYSLIPYEIYTKELKHKTQVKHILQGNEVTINNYGILAKLIKTDKTNSKSIKDTVVNRTILPLDYIENPNKELNYRFRNVNDSLPTGYSRHTKFELYKTRSGNVDVLYNGLKQDNYLEYPDMLYKDKNKIATKTGFVNEATIINSKETELTKEELSSIKTTDKLSRLENDNLDYSTVDDVRHKSDSKAINTSTLVSSKNTDNDLSKTNLSTTKTNDNVSESNTDSSKVQPNNEVYVEEKKIRTVPTNTLYTIED